MQTEEDAYDFKDFLEKTKVEWGRPPSLYYKPLTARKWQHFATYLDPYDGLLEFVMLGQQAAMYVLEGNLTPIDPDTEEPTGEMKRVRIFMHGALNRDILVATQLNGEDGFFSVTDEGEGMFANALKAAKYVLKNFPSLAASNAFGPTDEVED